MQITRLSIPDVVLIQPRVFGDARGHFFESWNRAAFAQALGQDIAFVQDNQSRSARGVLRGLHYQLPPAAQGKLVRVLRGAIFDVAVDLRRGGTSFGRWVGQRLDEHAAQQLWIPPGFAHGFLVLSDTADVLYKTSAPYAPALERTLRWDDPHIGIDWPLDAGTVPLLSDKDRAGLAWADAPGFDTAFTNGNGAAAAAP